MKNIYGILVGVILLPLVVHAGFDEGIAAYDRGDYETAYRELLPLAQQGKAKAQHYLGHMYLNGYGVPQDYVESARWYRRGADQGYTPAQVMLGSLYTNGQGVPQDYVEAVIWFQRAAVKGDILAETELGVMYFNGLGVSQHYVEAAIWFRRAAEQGYDDAQLKLGLLYAQGKGVPQDYVYAHFWFNLAAAQSKKNAAIYRDLIAEVMTPSQLAQAQQLAREWKPPKQRDKDNLKDHDARKGTARAEMVASGTGIVVTSNGHVVTNQHVTAECEEVRVALGKKAVSVIAFDATNDLALLKTDNYKTPATFREGRSIQQGEEITVIGYPLYGLLATGQNVTTGNVSALAGPGNDTRLLQITAPVQPGNSGGPLLDTGGNVVGIVEGKLNAIKVAQVTGDIPQNINFAINATVVRNFLDANNIAYVTAPSGKPLSTADIAQQAKHYTVLVECWK